MTAKFATTRILLALAALLWAICQSEGAAYAVLDVDKFELNDAGNPFVGLGGEYGKAPAPAVVDIDNDGDLDVFLGHKPTDSSGVVDLFLNVGSPESPSLVKQASGSNPLAALSGNYEYKPALADLDGDEDLDAVIGRDDDTLLYYKNTGTKTNAVFTLQTGGSDPFASVTVESYPSPAIADGSDDGLLDVFVGEATASHKFLLNAGSANSPSFMADTANSPLAGVSFQDFTGFSFGDLDDDGDLDLVLGAQNSSDPALPGVLRYFENTGSAANMVLTERTGASNPFDGFSDGGDAKPALADMDNDGDLDLLVGFSNGEIKYYVNEAIPSSGIKLDNAALDENQPAGTLVGTLSFHDGLSASYVYSFNSDSCGNDNIQFRIEGDQLLTDMVLDYELGARRSISLHAEGDQDSDDRCLTIVVNDVAESVLLSNNSAPENQPAGTVVGVFSHVGGAAGASYEYVLANTACGSDNDSFSIEGSVLSTAASLDYERDRLLEINVRVWDDVGSFPEDHCMTINVTNEPDTAPMAAIGLLLR